MNGAIFDSTFNMFFKLKYAHALRRGARDADGAARHRVGELRWSLMRGAFYSAAFLLVAWLARHGRVVVGRAGAAGRDADRLRVLGGRDVRSRRSCGPGSGLRLHQPRDHADVPLLRDVLPAVDLPRRHPVAGRDHPAVPGRGARARADARARSTPGCSGTWATSSCSAPSGSSGPHAGSNGYCCPDASALRASRCAGRGCMPPPGFAFPSCRSPRTGSCARCAPTGAAARRGPWSWCRRRTRRGRHARGR